MSEGDIKKHCNQSDTVQYSSCWAVTHSVTVVGTLLCLDYTVGLVY